MQKTIDEPKARPDVGCTELLDVLRASLARGLSVVDSPDIKHLVELPMTDSEYKRFIYFTSNATAHRDFGGADGCTDSLRVRR